MREDDQIIKEIDATPAVPAKQPAATGELVPVRKGALPAPLPRTQSSPRRWWLRLVLALAVLAAGVGGGYYRWQRLHPALPPGIVFGNGRLEADELNIDTKYAARIAEIKVDEGALVKAAQVVARMDTRDLQASLKHAEASVRQAKRAVDEAKANVVQQQTQVLLAKQEYDRATYLVQRGAETKEVLDQRVQQLNGANAALEAAQARVIESQHALEAATHDVELYDVEINDDTLIAPVDGRIQYRVANVGEVLAAGGHVFAMLDTSYVYMDIYLPTLEAGKVRYGADARIAVDAYPNVAIPAKVIYVATQAQFTPKTVETATEREKLMFRIRVRIDADWLRGRSDAVSSGLPGVAYILASREAKWPPSLQGQAAPVKTAEPKATPSAPTPSSDAAPTRSKAAPQTSTPPPSATPQTSGMPQGAGATKTATEPQSSAHPQGAAAQ
jgi:HlyD family secretion protein